MCVYTRGPEHQRYLINSENKSFWIVCTRFRCTPLNGIYHGDWERQSAFESDHGDSWIDYHVVSSDLLFNAEMGFEVGIHVQADHVTIQLSIMIKDIQTQPDKQNKQQKSQQA